ncbi:hypothetical protein GH714_004209 [Hevea brasiliensis]|uniref:Uncharacterized protein n=1 Tax=Hevea brasiliensis TaxID=3981 RepID=A0A6A6L0E7_HEVBR|nr:hypothetical protein GH714_004209 [Hevea brasiliensis]
MGTVDFHRLESISDDDCWLLFTKHAFENRRDNALANQEIIREKVINKCGGLPLAARTLGGLLRAKHEEWEDMLNSKIWNLQDDESGDGIDPFMDGRRFDSATDGERQPEDVGAKYFQDLLSRSLLQASIDGNPCL